MAKIKWIKFPNAPRGAWVSECGKFAIDPVYVWLYSKQIDGSRLFVKGRRDLYGEYKSVTEAKRAAEGIK